jgi:hypothetical protein
MECGLAISMPVYGVAKAPVGNLPPLYTPCPGAVPIIPLPGITLASFASEHAAEWFHISTEKLCYQSQFLIGSSSLSVLNTRFPPTNSGGINTRFSSPVSVENNCCNGFSFTGSLKNVYVSETQDPS